MAPSNEVNCFGFMLTPVAPNVLPKYLRCASTTCPLHHENGAAAMPAYLAMPTPRNSTFPFNQSCRPSTLAVAPMALNGA